MNKTIEEAVWNFARKQWGKQVPHTIDKIADLLIDFGNEIRTMPLSSRLNAEEKERVRNMYKRMELDAQHSDSYDCIPSSDMEDAIEALESIFGADFFKEEE